MNPPRKTPSPQPQERPQQREALEDSEKKASRTHPENFKDEATEEKVVEIGPIETSESSSIQGIDPEE